MSTFAPKTNYVMSVSATSVNISISDVSMTTLRVYNAGPNKCFIRWGTGTQSAVASDLALAPDSIETFFKSAANAIAAITSGGTEVSLLYMSIGAGK